jgi:hypothetical protein
MKIGAETVDAWRSKAERWLTVRGFSIAQVITGRDAWAVAHGAGITREAYGMSRDVCDAHIQTALEKIFPAAVFQDKKRY